jgi:hypothetical protein
MLLFHARHNRLNNSRYRCSTALCWHQARTTASSFSPYATCATLSLNLSSQRRRISASDTLHLEPFRVTQGHQVRTLDFLPLADLGL